MTRRLLRLPNWIGDAIMVLPSLRSLRPEDESWLGVAHSRVLPLYRATGWFDRLHAAGGASAPVALARTIRGFRPRSAVVFPRAISGALLASLSGAPERWGWDGPLRGALLNRRVPPGDRSRPLWLEFFDLAAPLGGTVPARPDFTLDPGPEAAARAAALVPSVPAVALAPGAVYGPAKQWPLEHFVQLCRMAKGKGWTPVVLGGRNESKAGAVLRNEGAIDLAGRTSLLEAIAVLARCAAVVTNDSGALHLARAAGTRVIALFGSSSPAWTGPEPHEGEALFRGLACSPCFARRCPLPGDARMQCLRSITPQEVLVRLEGEVSP
ncbi:MAG: lipopolysaccharide heptosyltransferase II [Gemmatimonadetes bacterium]|nr:lipopolysaccharide heptosyltransferase II [Gemmatimonadota bacterium]